MTLPIVFVLAGVLLIVVPIPLIRRQVGPNAYYGLRVRATYADRRVWYDANERAGRDFVRLGVLQIVVAAGLLAFLPPARMAYAWMNTAVLLVGVIAVAVTGTRRANRMLRELGDGEPDGRA